MGSKRRKTKGEESSLKDEVTVPPLPAEAMAEASAPAQATMAETASPAALAQTQEAPATAPDETTQTEGRTETDGTSKTGATPGTGAPEKLVFEVEPPSKAVVLFFSLLRFWWLPSSFLGPWGIMTLIAHARYYDVKNLAIYAGMAGLGCALMVYGLWTFDRKVLRGGEPPRKKDRNEDILIYGLGITLWLMWVTTAHIVLIAHDEVNSVLPPVVPGNQ